MEDLEKFTQDFFGYGNIKSDIWFIGHEEGSKQNFKKLVSEMKRVAK